MLLVPEEQGHVYIVSVIQTTCSAVATAAIKAPAAIIMLGYMMYSEECRCKM